MQPDKNSRCLVIPDIHQNHDFLETILRREDPDTFSDIVLLGDFIDAKDQRYNSAAALERTLTLVVELLAEQGDKVEILLGNHDVMYYYMQDMGHGSPLVRSVLMDYYGLPDREILSICSREQYRLIWRKVCVATLKNNYLLSHAGVTIDFWNTELDVEQNIVELTRHLDQVVDHDHEIRSFFRAGFTRGGDMPRGGPLWLDWNLEFKDELPLPQIVGHTAGIDWRQTGRSYCLDARQSCYAVLDREGVHPSRIESD